jgi:hypothetical protein
MAKGGPAFVSLIFDRNERDRRGKRKKISLEKTEEKREEKRE